MGIGFVLIIWAVLAAMFGIPALLVLLAVAHRTGGRARAKRVFHWLLVAAPSAAVYLVVWFLAYAFWCSAVRGVDVGIGDSFSVALGHGFSLTAIDVPENAYIFPRDQVGGEALVGDIAQIGQSGRYIYGTEGRDSAFVLDTESGVVRRSLGRELPATLRAAGVASDAMVPVGDFYQSHRWAWDDLVAVLALLGPVLFVGGRSARRAWGAPPLEVVTLDRTA